jgi:3-oxoacyl-[acyl-carrier-protein] synthase III
MTDLVKIVDCLAYQPKDRLDLIELSEKFNTDADFLKNKTGFLKVARKSPEQTASDLAEKAVLLAFEKDPSLRSRAKCLIVVTQNPDGFGLPHASAILHQKLDLPKDVAAFDISLGCSGWVYGLSIATSFMQANNIEDGLLVTSDPYSSVLDPDDRNTQLLFGDAATVTVLSQAKSGWSPGRFKFGTDGSGASSLMVDETRTLHMNGRAVFNFSAKVAPVCIRETLADNKLDLDDVDQVVLHQGSRYIVDTIGKRIGKPEKTPFFENDIGNSVSSTIPMILASGACDQSKKIVVCGFGVGLSWAATVLTNHRN